MEISISGVPVQYWYSLKKPIRKAIEEFLDDKESSYGDQVVVNFFGTQDEHKTVTVAINRRSSLRLEVAHIVGAICMGHSIANNNWFRRFQLI